MPLHHTNKKNISLSSGFTLTEILVAAVIIGIAIVAVVSMSRKSREIDMTYYHHRRARAVIDSCFESPYFNYTLYDSIPLGSASSTVLIDSRTGIPLNGTLSIGVSLDSIAGVTVQTHTTMVVFKKCSANVTWTEPEGDQSVNSVKTVPKL